MLFNEIIETQGINEIASTTNISVVNLEYLLEENFEKLNRVRALGFLLILEREYKEIDVSALREKIKAYYDENDPDDHKVVMVPTDSIEGKGSSISFFKIFIIFTLLGGGYYLYTQGELDSLLQKFENKQDFFDDNKALESNVSDADANKVVVGKSNNESVTITTPVAPKPKTIVLNDKTLDNKKEEIKEIQTALNTAKVEENKSVESVLKEVSKEFLAKEKETTLEPVEVSQSNESEVSITMVNVNPTRGMLWFGFINLDSKKRREFMKKVSTPFNINGSRWLLVTGHGFLDVVTDDKTLELADNKKHYFYIDSNELREISKAEFRELNGHRGW